MVKLEKFLALFIGIGAIAGALPYFAANLRLKSGSLDVVSFQQVAVPKRASVVEIDAIGGLQRSRAAVRALANSMRGWQHRLDGHRFYLAHT